MRDVFKIGYLRNILIVSSVIAVGLPIGITLIVLPSFSRMIVDNTEDEAIRLATHIEASVISGQVELSRDSLPRATLRKLNQLAAEFGLMKLKLFARSGEILFSTDSKDIGSVNEEAYFHNVVAKGGVYTKIVEKDKPSLEGQIVTADVVETYVPITSNSEVLGAVEIYYDITARKAGLDRLLFASAAVLILLAIGLQGTVVIILSKAAKSIVQHTQAEDALRESEERLQSIIDNATAVIYLKDTQGRYMLINKRCETLLQITSEQINGKTDSDILPEEAANDMRENDRKVIDVGGPIEFEEIVPHDDGPHTYISIKFPLRTPSGSIYAVCGISTDITDRRKLEEALLKTAKLESLATLSGGIAHDFNNLLSIILGYLSLSKDDIEDGSESSEYIQEAENATLRAKDLTTRLITFSKGGDPVKKVMAIGAFVKESVQSALGGSGADCDISVPAELFPVECDEDQMKQVINNITINAHEAMDGKGVVRVYCENVMIGDRDPLQIEEGRYVRISIEDQGVGISEENLGKIFDPYFSTKERGTEKGMGLGLSVCHSIVEKHNGLITVDSELGAGTIFALYLPASEKAITEPKPPEADLQEELVRGSGKILVMDDEEMIRELAINRLNLLGYAVEVAGDGAESITLYKNARDSGEAFDVVILDLTIKMGMGGKETIRELLTIDPDVKGIVATGYSNDPVVSNCREYGFRGALTKPYSTYELSQVLHDVISGE